MGRGGEREKRTEQHVALLKLKRDKLVEWENKRFIEGKKDRKRDREREIVKMKEPGREKDKKK